VKHVLEGDSWIGLVNELVIGSTGLFGERGYAMVPRIPEIQDVRIKHDVPKGSFLLAHTSTNPNGNLDRTSPRAINHQICLGTSKKNCCARVIDSVDVSHVPLQIRAVPLKKKPLELGSKGFGQEQRSLRRGPGCESKDMTCLSIDDDRAEGR
jgi:hypothetical protein